MQPDRLGKDGARPVHLLELVERQLGRIGERVGLGVDAVDELGVRQDAEDGPRKRRGGRVAPGEEEVDDGVAAGACSSCISIGFLLGGREEEQELG